MEAPTLIVIIHDSITNSVFTSQVLNPLINELKKKQYQQVVIISFEKRHFTAPEIARFIPDRADLRCVIMQHRIPFFGKITLLPAAYALQRILRTYTQYHLQARGPIAGWIALKARTRGCLAITIQARGLLAQEHAYTLQCENKQNVIHTIRTRLYASLESTLYSVRDAQITIQAVSPALADYLIQEFHTNKTDITIASNDIPQKIPANTVSAWRATYRTHLGIAHDAPVFCYNGSGKAWQRPELVFAFFHKKLLENQKSILLILTQDQKEFTPFITQYAIGASVIMHTIAHHEIYQYLAVADVGLLFREENRVNWVSRPTKMLEYEAIGLKIAHNDTIAWLAKNRPEDATL